MEGDFQLVIAFVSGRSSVTLNDLLPTSTVLEVQKRVETEAGIPFNAQRLLFEGKLLGSDSTLNDYAIETKSTLYVNVRTHPPVDLDKAMQIFLRGCSPCMATLHDVFPTSTVGELAVLIEAKTSIPVDMQRLIFGGKQLEFGNTLQHSE